MPSTKVNGPDLISDSANCRTKVEKFILKAKHEGFYSFAQIEEIAEYSRLLNKVSHLTLDWGPSEIEIASIHFQLKQIERRIDRFDQARMQAVTEFSQDIELEYITEPFFSLNRELQIIQNNKVTSMFDVTDPFSSERTKNALKALTNEKPLTELIPEAKKELDTAREEYIEFKNGLARSVDTIKSYEISLADLKKRYSESLPIFDEILGKGSKAGLVAAWHAKENTLFWSKWLWAFIFLVLLGVLLGLALYAAIHGMLTDPSTLPAKMTVGLPLIWGAWFCAKQFGYTSRLQEDYSFKWATARSFEAYKAEATSIDPALLTDLIKASMSNFSDHPLRIFNIKNDAASPMEELIELAKDEKTLNALEKILGMVKGKKE